MARRTARAVGGQGDRRLEHLGERPELVHQSRARDGTIELAISDAILDEFSRILHDKLEWSDDRLNSIRVEVATFTKLVSSTETLDVVRPTRATTESSNAPSPPGPM
jgi:hypothetical protein